MTRGRAMKARGRSALAKLSVPLVWRYGRDLTDDARRGRLDPVEITELGYRRPYEYGGVAALVALAGLCLLAAARTDRIRHPESRLGPPLTARMGRAGARPAW